MPDTVHLWRLFLDELPEFGTRNLEMLRQPIEDRVVTISRVNGSLTYLAAFLFISAMNPCRLAFFGVGQHKRHLIKVTRLRCCLI
jgi:magnesium chelatase family protein